MRKSLYPRLAAQSLKLNRRFFVPYILSLMGNVAAFYIMSALVNDPGVQDMTPGRTNGYYYVQMMMSMGMFVAFVFSVIFVFYINGFLMKQRKRELGLYNILGMGKNHIAALMLLEGLYVGVIGIAGGLAVGMLLHKLVTLLLYRALDFGVPLGFYISWKGLTETAILFAGLIAATVLVNLVKIQVSRPIELLRGGNVGEREPKTRWLMTLLGILTLGGGYFIAVRTSSGVEAIAFYFVVVFLVIIGTYCLFTAVSVFVLKALRRNKKFYYRTGPFISVSGMLYRMKQNAVGLANICILCTMVMVMISGTLSLWLGTEDISRRLHPSDLQIYVAYHLDEEDPFNAPAMLTDAENYINSEGVTVTGERTMATVRFGVGLDADGVFHTNTRADEIVSIYSVDVLTASAYTDLTGETVNLQSDEVMVYGTGLSTLEFRWDNRDDGEEKHPATVFQVVRNLRESPWFSPQISNQMCLIVADESVLTEIYQAQLAAYGEEASLLDWYAYLDLDCSDEECQRLTEDYWEGNKTDYGAGRWEYMSWNSSGQGRSELYGLAGGFLFLGLFLGFIFLMATVLIIYYKQISEGYEDKRRFEIMQKVGLSREEVRTAIRSQVLMVFFLPIVVAAIHIAFDFNMVEKLLTLFYLHDTALTALCTLGTLLVFFLVYGVVYLLTARTYYKIVER